MEVDQADVGSVRVDGWAAVLRLLVVVPAILWLGVRRDAGRWAILVRVAAACYAAP